MSFRIGNRVCDEFGNYGRVEEVGQSRLRAYLVYWFGLRDSYWCAESHVMHPQDFNPRNHYTVHRFS